jgi:hypothetical protein
MGHVLTDILADIIEIADTVVANYAHRAETGELSTDDAKKQSIAHVHVQGYVVEGKARFTGR